MRLPLKRYLALLAKYLRPQWHKSVLMAVLLLLEIGLQLLAFIRILLTNPGLVILDEASSRLDPATEQLIERAISKLLAGRTGIVIAHRLATLQRVDEIMVLEDGCIVEYGRREVLANDATARFAQLLQTGLEEVRAS